MLELNLNGTLTGVERPSGPGRPRDADQPVLHPVGREANRGAVSEAEHFDDGGARGDAEPLRRKVLWNRPIGILKRVAEKQELRSETRQILVPQKSVQKCPPKFQRVFDQSQVY